MKKTLAIILLLMTLVVSTNNTPTENYNVDGLLWEVDFPRYVNE